jgi:hypothetical protein
MEGKQAGIFRLFIITIFFCCSIFFLNNNKKNLTTATHIDICNVKGDAGTHLSLDRVYQEISSLFYTHDIDLIIKTIGQFKYNFAYDLVEKMVDDTDIRLSYEEKIKIISAMVAHYACPKRSVNYDFFDIFLKYPDLTIHTSPLLSLARGKHADLIGMFIAWGKDRQKMYNKTGLLAGYAEQAFTQAVREDDPIAIETLFSKKVRIAPSVASNLLWYIVEHSKESTMIGLLVDHAQADVNYTNNGKTLLVEAVECNNIHAVRTLLDKGAVVDRIVDGDKGTALTIAMKCNYQGIEQLLREYGD